MFLSFEGHSLRLAAVNPSQSSALVRSTVSDSRHSGAETGIDGDHELSKPLKLQQASASNKCRGLFLYFSLHLTGSQRHQPAFVPPPPGLRRAAGARHHLGLCSRCRGGGRVGMSPDGSPVAAWFLQMEDGSEMEGGSGRRGGNSSPAKGTCRDNKLGI